VLNQVGLFVNGPVANATCPLTNHPNIGADSGCVRAPLRFSL